MKIWEEDMTFLKDTVQTGDWKGEKHVPAIVVESAKKGNTLVKVKVGEEIAHPNTLEHHIAWLKLYYLPEGSKLPIELANVNFSANGESNLFTEPETLVRFKAEKNGQLFAQSYCNIHGLWESQLDLVLED